MPQRARERSLFPQVDGELCSPAGFDYTAAIRRVCQDVVERTCELAHVDLSRVAISFSQARQTSNWGLFASLTPLRFAGGAETSVRRGRRYGIQRFKHPDGHDYLYILTLCLPRFQNLDLREKLITVFHELWHISPAFDGDIRRHEGRCYAHTPSQAEYDKAMGRLADAWLSQQADDAVWAFLRWSFGELQERRGPIFGLRLPRPRLIPLE